jgi:hypothetical protein
MKLKTRSNSCDTKCANYSAERRIAISFRPILLQLIVYLVLAFGLEKTSFAVCNNCFSLAALGDEIESLNARLMDLGRTAQGLNDTLEAGGLSANMENTFTNSLCETEEEIGSIQNDIAALASEMEFVGSCECDESDDNVWDELDDVPEEENPLYDPYWWYIPTEDPGIPTWDVGATDSPSANTQDSW